MRRSLAALFFAIASMFAGLAIGGLWLTFVAFSPERSSAAAEAVLDDEEIKNHVADIIAQATASQLGVDPAQVREVVRSTAATSEGAEILARVIGESHGVVIGARQPPVQITSADLVQVLRTERAAVLPAVELPVEKVGVLSLARQTLKWLVPISGAVALVLVLLGLLTHPERGELLRSLSYLLLGIALFLVIVGYVIPVALIPRISDNIWLGTAPRLAGNALPFLIGLVLLLVGGAGLCFALAGSNRRRDRWSQPVHRSRHETERRWS